MNFNISSSALFSILQNASRVIATKQTMPILDHFLFVLKDTKLTITATDLESTIISEIEVDIAEQDGSAAIPSRIIIDALRELSDQPINFSVGPDGSDLLLKWQSGEIMIPCTSGLGFPEVDIENTLDSRSITLTGPELLAGINKTIFAVANSESRPTINGILMDISAESVVFVATDTFQLVKVAISKETGIEEPAMVIITKKSASLLKNIVSKDLSEVKIEFGGKGICFVFEGCTYISRVIEGRYPNYNSVIPKSNPNSTIIDRVALSSCVRRVSVCSNQGTDLIKLNIEKDQIKLEAQDIDFSTSAKDSISCSSKEENTDVSIGLKSKNIIEMMSVISSEEVLLEFTDPTRPILFSPVDSKDIYESNMVIMLMPVSL